VEERQKSVRDVLAAFRTRSGAPVPLEADVTRPEYWTARTRLLRCEATVLAELGFHVFVTDHAHKYVLSYLKLLGGIGGAALAQAAVSIANDVLRTDACVRFRPETVATATMFLAARMLRVGLPETPADRAWWLLFDTSREEIDGVCEALKKLYSLGTPRMRDETLSPPSPPPPTPAGARTGTVPRK
jgi:hypothetical protein